MDNDPTNYTDPFGLKNVVLGVFEGPKFAQIANAKPPVVIYTQNRGAGEPLETLMSWSGTWGQPYNGASGSGNKLRNGDTDINGREISGADFGGARSYLKLASTGEVRPYCNTVLAGPSGSTDSAELVAWLYRFKPGKYNVTAQINYKLEKGSE